MSVVKTFVVVFFCLIALVSRAQTVENVVSSYDGEKMVITYDLNATAANQKFKVSLFSSHNNYSQPLTLLTGDAGDNVLPGKGRSVAWDVKNSVPSDFDGDISIKVKATLMIPAVVKTEPVKTESVQKLSMRPLVQNSYKKGSTIDMNWSGGQPGDQLNVELLKGGVAQQKIIDKTNGTQNYSWQTPGELKPGKDYAIRITNSSRASDVAVSQTFTIKPKIPLLLKVAPVVVVGAVVFIISSGSKSGKDDATSLSDLPGPVKPN